MRTEEFKVRAECNYNFGEGGFSCGMTVCNILRKCWLPKGIDYYADREVACDERNLHQLRDAAKVEVVYRRGDERNGN